MALAPKRGSPIPLIIFVVLFVAASVGFVLRSIKVSELEVQAEKLEQGLADSEQRVKKEIADKERYLSIAGQINLDKLKEDVGEQAKRIYDDIDVKELPKALDTLLKNAAEKTISVQEFTRELKPLIRRIIDAGERGGDPTLLELIKMIELEKQAKAAELAVEQADHQRDVNGLNAQIEAKDKQIAAKQDEIDGLKSDLNKQKSAHDAELVEEKKRAAGLDDQLTTEREKWKKDIAARDKALTEEKQINTKLRKVVADITKQKRKGKTRTRRFVTEREPADGRVILVSRQTGIIVDVGRQQGVRRELRFQVYTEKADGTRWHRGDIEIKTVYPKISRAALVEGGNPVDVVHKGDILVNPAFHPGKAMVFVADTTFGAAKKQALREHLGNYGSVLEDKVTLRTDYLIVGATRGDLWDEADKLGVLTIREDELNAFLGR